MVLTYTAIFGSMIYAPLLWDPIFGGNAVEWDEVPVCFVITLLVCFVCLLPFYLLLLLFWLFKLKQIPHDSWYLQVFAGIVYSFFILTYQMKVTDLINWYLAYYPVGIAFFVWYTKSKNKAVVNNSAISEELE